MTADDGDKAQLHTDDASIPASSTGAAMDPNVIGQQRVERFRRVLSIVLAICGTLLLLHNLLPYVGLRWESCQTMYSGLANGVDRNNHLVMPQYSWSDLGFYYEELKVSLQPIPAPGTKADILRRWLSSPGVRLNAEAVRSAVDQLCESSVHVALRVRRTPDPDWLDVEDACASDRFGQRTTWAPIRLYKPELGIGESPS